MVLTDSKLNMPESDYTLLEGLKNQDKRCIERIYRENYNMIQSLVINNNGDIDDAADIFQEAMIVLYEKSLLDNFKLSCRLKTFIYSICRRLWLKKLQKNHGRHIKVELLEDTIPVEEVVEDHEKKQENFKLMEKAMAKIGEPCRSLLNAYYIEKKPMQQIASDFGYTNADNAKTQKYKCLVRLKKIFFADYKNEK